MNLRSKAILGTVLLTGSLSAALFAGIAAVTWIGFAQIESDQLHRDGDRFRLALLAELEGLSAAAADWSAHDEIVALAAGRGDRNSVARVAKAAFPVARVDAAVFVDAAGREVWSYSAERSPGDAAPSPATLSKPDWRSDPLVRFERLGVAHRGILRASDAPYLVCSHAIASDKEASAVGGAVVFARRLDQRALDEIAGRARLHARLLPLDHFGDAQTTAQLHDVFDPKAAPVVQIATDWAATASYRVDDPYGWSPYCVTITTPRTVAAQARRSLWLLVACWAAAGAALTLAVAWLFHRLVLTRLLRLAGDVRALGSGGRLSRPVDASGDDELSDLARAVDQMVHRQADAHQQLRAARAAAENASRAKSEFLANMSHEIRTPMTAILGYTDLLLASLCDSEHADSLHTVQRNGRYLLQIINDILDLSKIEAGRMVLEPGPCDPGAVADEVVSLLRVRAESKGLALTLECVGSPPTGFRCDPVRLRQILVNLVGNAIKFTVVGGVRLTLHTGDAKSPQRIHFCVVDSGIGMTPEQVARLFRPFVQLAQSSGMKAEGTGLGLTISKRLAEMLGGELSVQSQPGQGTILTLSLPLDAPAPTEPHMPSPATPNATVHTPPPAGVSAAPPPSIQGLRVLLAEDSLDNQRFLAVVLRKAGAVVTVASNGQEAFDAATLADRSDQPFGVVLMDMQMPVLDGYQATAALRRSGYARPIIALTAFAMPEDRRRCMEAGCDDYATKPIDRDALVETIARWAVAGRRPSPPAALAGPLAEDRRGV